MSRTQEVTIPDIGDLENVPIIEVLVKPGDPVKAEQALVTLESEKATLDMPTPCDGVVNEVLVAVDDQVSEGTAIVVLGLPQEPSGQGIDHNESGAGRPSVDEAVQQTAETPNSAPRKTSQPAARGRAADAAAPGRDPDATALPPHAGPSVRSLARELDVDLAQVTGTGPKGRIQRDDLVAFVKRKVAQPAHAAGSGIGINLPPWPAVDFGKYGDIERVPLSRIRRISGPSLARNWVTIPHVTNFDEADVTELEAFRTQINAETGDSSPKLTMLAFVIKAGVAALKRFPEFNASLDGDELVLKHYYHIGFAADTANGLVVPVLKDADRKGVAELASEMASLAAQAREGKLKPTDMQGGCFSVSSLGGIGGTGFTPIINAPEVAILGAARAKTEVVWDGQAPRPRLIMPLSLSWDHRVVDGAAAARFLQYLTQLLSDFRRISL